ncbi:MAG: hypothetical protein J1E41_00910 [Ruminococcus sp.]|nr:hypothetical protein [Ruminococcus sp.]
MNFEKILNRFKLISGLADDEAQKWGDLIKESNSYVRGLVTKVELFDSDEDRIDNASAVYAYYRYICYNVDEESSFSAGTLKVNLNQNKLTYAKKMWESELEGLSDLTDTSESNSTFVFKRV